MRLPFRVAPVDYVLNVFTSFGYFDDPSENVAIVHNMATVLEPGGRVVLDYLNASHVGRHLAREQETEIDGTRYSIARWTTGDSIVKRIRVYEPGADAPLEFFERVSKFTFHDFQFMFAVCELEVEQVFGDYQLGPFDLDTSPRLILVVRRR